MSAATAMAEPATAAPKRGSGFGLAVALLAPIALVNAAGFLLPVLNLARMSFYEVEPTGMMREVYTLATWMKLVTDSFYGELLLNSITVSLGITLLTLLCSYPIALYLHRSSGTWKTVLLVLVISPLLTSAVVRTYGWIAILSDSGLVNNGLAALGLGRIRLMFNQIGVTIGLTEILMPYMILALLAGFGRLDRTLEEAARSLGASPFRTFRRVTLPLSLPAIALAAGLGFVLSMSAYITPKLLGGGRVFVLATEIFEQATTNTNWPVAAVLAIYTLVLLLALLVVSNLAARRLQR